MERLLADATKLTGIKYDITNLSDVYSAIHVIQTDLGLTGVAAQEASTTLSGSFGAMKAAAQNFLGYLVIGEDVTAAMDTLVKSVATFLGGNLFPAISNILKSLPPAIGNLIGQISPEFIANGLSMLSNMLKGITNNLDKVIQTATTLVKNLLSGISKKLPEIIAMGVTLIGKLVTGLLKAIPDIIREIPTIFKNIVSGFKKQNWAKIGRDIINGIISGVKNMGGALMSAARQAGQNALSSIKNALGIHSPSKVFDQEVGQMIGKGLIAGIQKSTLSIPAIMTGIAEDTVAPATDTISTEAASTSTDSSIADAIREGFAAWSNNQAVELSINMDGTTVAKKIYKPFMKLMKQKGATNG